MNRVLASVLAPILLYILMFIYAYMASLNSVFNQPYYFSFHEFFIVYIFSFPVFFILGIPLSILLDKIKGVRFINYLLPGLG